ncbi:unnamed protein product [Brachionus calyciflorus]|uniref:Protein YIPF n=1 Tax=Brachionus calyciflorus TaxID=104777 RepID=A0A814CJF1_9BILA|nr:unnamed protein product [Brachionus calyciflorus]
MSNSNEETMQFLNAGSNFSDLEGELNVPTQNRPQSSNKTATILNMGSTQEIISTLDEPVSVTISRDLKAVAYKFGHVFFPKQSTLLLRDWDLWGPLTLCVILSITLEGDSKLDSNAPEFASIFALISFGAIIVTINTKLLSGKISFFQSICVLGYCLLPLVLVAILNDLILLITGNTSVISFSLRFILTLISCFWSVFASTAFLAADTINLTDRKALATYPVFLFYFVISWLIVLDTN